LTVLKNGLIPKISLFYQEGKPLEKIQASKLFVGPAKADNKCQTLQEASVPLDIVDTKSKKLNYMELSSSNL
jgi:hypothetical protein